MKKFRRNVAALAVSGALAAGALAPAAMAGGGGALVKLKCTNVKTGVITFVSVSPGGLLAFLAANVQLKCVVVVNL
jgi:hypothetical protein